MAGHAHQAAHTLRYEVEATAPSVWAGNPEPGDCAVHHGWIEFSRLLVSKPHAFQRAGPEVLDKYIVPTRHVEDYFATLISSEVHDDAALISVDPEERGGLAFNEGWPHASGVVASAGLFYLHHVRAHIH